MKYLLILILFSTSVLAQPQSGPPAKPHQKGSPAIQDMEKEKQDRLDKLDEQAKELARIWREKQLKAKQKKEQDRLAEIERQKQLAIEKEKERQRLQKLDTERKLEFERIKKLQQEAERLRLEREAEEARIKKVRDDERRRKEAEEAFRRQQEQLKKQRELAELKKQREEAEKKIQEENARKAALADQAMQLPPPPSTDSSTAGTSAIAPPTTNPSSAFPEPDGTLPVDSKTAIAPSEMEGSPDQAGDPSLVNGEIDRLGLATSLFGVNNWKGCLRAMESIDSEELTPENRLWLQYLYASCHRKLGNLSEAESAYRTLLSQTKKGWLADAGRWWLDHINERRKTESSLDELRAQTVAWRAELEKLKTNEQPGI